MSTPRHFHLMAAPHLPDGAKEDDNRRQVLADERALAVAQTGRAGAGAEGLPVPALDADVVSVTLGLVGNFVQVRFVAADAHTLILKPGRRPLELLFSLNLNHLLASVSDRREYITRT